MIPRISRTRHRRQDEFAFGHGEKARALRIFVDGEVVPDSPELEVLLAFSHHAEVEIIGTDGRFANVLSIGIYDPHTQMTRCEITFSNRRRIQFAVTGQETPARGREYAGAGEAERGERAAVMSKAVASQQSDALVTTDPLILERFPPLWIEGANPMPIGDAVALLGLFLRVREDFVVDIGENYRDEFDRSLFYWVLLRDLTPRGWRWFSACVEHSQHVGDDALLLTAQTALERIGRAFRARDRMHEKLQLPSTRDTATEAVFYFDVALFMLGGVFDVLAKVAHGVHQLGGSERSVGWGVPKWMKKLAAANPALAQMMAWGKPHRDARELVAVLRNTIHQEALRTITWHKPGARLERVIPAAIETDLEAVVGRMGTPEEFGISRERLDGHLYIDPGVYVERILPPVFDAINAIMDATPVETLAGVDLTKLPAGPPTDDGSFNEPTRERIRLLGGVG